MVETRPKAGSLIEVDFVRVQKRTGGSYMVTIPADAVKALHIEGNEKMKVLLDAESKRVIFQLMVFQEKLD